MILHGFVDVEIRARRRVEAGEQLVHDHEQLHVRRFLDEECFCSFLVALRFRHARFRFDVFKQFGVRVVNELLFGLGIRADFFFSDILRLRIVRGDHGASASERRLLKEREILGGVVDARSHQDGVAAFAGKAGLDAEVKDDVAHHTLHARPGAEHLLHGAPLLLELGAGKVRQPLSFGFEPLIHLLRRGEVLVDVAGLVAQVQHDAVPHGLVELVGVDVAAEDLEALLLVGLEQRRAGEADEHGPRQDRLHRLV